MSKIIRGGMTMKKTGIIAGALAFGISMTYVQSSIPATAVTNDEIAVSIGYDIKYSKDSKGQTWFYCDMNDGKIQVWGTIDPKDYVEVPETIDGKIVASIGRVVVNTDIYPNGDVRGVTKLKLPNTINEVNPYAFDNLSNLKDVEVPDTVSLDGRYPNLVVSGQSIVNKAENQSYKTGWSKRGNDYYYVINNLGETQTGWADIGGGRYYFYFTGEMATGFLKLGDSAVYYLDPAGGSNMGNLVTGWKMINGTWYYFNPQAAGDKEKGYMQTGWLYNGGSWYYFYGNGQMATGFINLNGAYYYLDASNTSGIGIMKTGWQKINGYWYYFNSSADSGITGLMNKGWKKIGGSWYYFYEQDGKMAANTYVDGYKIGADGAWIY